MKKKIFENLIEKPKSTKKWFFLPLSLLVHSLVIAAIVVLPLMSESANLPQLKIVEVFIGSPPVAPSVPTAAAAEGSSKSLKKRPVDDVKKPAPVTTNRFVAPIEIPDEIEDENFDFGTGEGVPGGVPGGIPGGIPGGVIGGVPLLGDGDTGLKNPLQHSLVEPPRLIKRVEPQYPQIAIKAHVQGIVFIQAVTDVYGRVVKTRIIKGNPLLNTAAVQAVRQWVYEPYIINGIPKPVVFTVSVNFRLQH